MARINLILWIFLIIVVNVVVLWFLSQLPELRQQLRDILKPLSVEIDPRKISESDLPPVPTGAQLPSTDKTLWYQEGYHERNAYGLLPKRNESQRPAYTAYASKSRTKQGARLAIVIADLGFDTRVHGWAISLPPMIGLVYSVYSPDLQGMVSLARGTGHEVLIDLPVIAQDPNIDRGHLQLEPKNPDTFLPRFYTVLGKATGYVGVYGDLSSLVKVYPSATAELIKDLEKRGLILLDYKEKGNATLNQRFGRSKLRLPNIRVRDDTDLRGQDFALALKHVKQELDHSNTALVWLLPPIRPFVIALSNTLKEENLPLVPISNLAQ